MIELHNCDCLPFMKGCGDNEFGLAICDPNYGIGEDGSRNKTRGKLAISKDYKPYIGGDLKPPDKEYFDEQSYRCRRWQHLCKRGIVPGRHSSCTCGATHQQAPARETGQRGT